MFEGVNFIAVLGTTFFMLASATVWFSPLLFGKQWLHELNVSESDLEKSKDTMVQHLGFTGVGYFISLTIIAALLATYEPLKTELPMIAFSIAALVISLFATTALWEHRSKQYFLITAGFYCYFCIVGLFLISYWPW